MISMEVILESGHIRQQFIIFTSLGSRVIIILPLYVEMNEYPILALISNVPFPICENHHTC